MTEQEKKAFEALSQDLPKYSISDGTRRYIAMDLAKKGYRKDLNNVKELLSIIEGCISEIDGRVTYLSSYEDEVKGYEKDDLERSLMQLAIKRSALNSLYDKISERYGIEEDNENN